MKALTARQQEVFDLIRDHISQTGMPPTRAEIAQRLGFRSPNAAEEHLKALARKGVIEIVSGASRGIRLLQEEEEVVEPLNLHIYLCASRGEHCLSLFYSTVFIPDSTGLFGAV